MSFSPCGAAGRLNQYPPVSAVCALWNFGLAGWCLYPLARGCRAPRRMTPELAATAPAIPVWRYRLVAGAAELGGSVADRGACNNAVRGIRRVCSLEFRAGGMVSLSVGAWLPSAAPDDAIKGTPTRECETVARRRGAQADYVANMRRRTVR